MAELTDILNSGDVSTMYMGGTTDSDKVLTVGTVLANNTLTVGKDNSQFTTIKAAVDSITDNDSTNQYVVLVAPGTYGELGTVQCKPYVSIRSVGGSDVTSVMPVTANTNAFDLSAFSSVTGFHVIAVLGSNAYAFSHTVAGIASITDCMVNYCNNGILVNHVDAITVIKNVGETSSIGNIERLLHVLAGRTFVNGLSTGFTTTAAAVVEVDGANAQVSLNGLESRSPGVTTGLLIKNGGQVDASVINLDAIYDGIVMEGTNTAARLDVVKVSNAQNDAFRINDVGTNVRVTLFGATLTWADNLNVNILNPNTSMAGTGFSEMTKVHIVQGTDIIASFLDTTEDDEGLNIFGELHVGNPRHPTESAFGEGDSYTNGMLTYTFDGTSTFTDVTAAASTASGSSFTFPNTGVDAAIYIASTISNTSGLVPHFGIKSKVDTAAVLGAGSIVTEYWDGSTWSAVSVMETESSGNYYQHASSIFEQVGSHQIRYDSELAINGWTKNDPMTLNTDYYWIRFRIATAVTTAPVLQQFKLHSNRFEVNGDGWTEYYGTARPFDSLPWDMNLAKPAVSSPLNRDVFLSDKLDVGRTENQFANVTDRVGFNSYLPYSLDTSSGIHFRWSYISATAGPANVKFVVRWGFSHDGMSVYNTTSSAPTTGVNEQSIILIAPVDAIETQYTSSVKLDVSNMASRSSGTSYGDMIWITLERNGEDVLDTYEGNITLINLSPIYAKWNNGGHNILVN